ncbi:hypothetical protein [Thermogemmatispora sp.]|uniref:hypothetical protein n=1 Tax=Thermogemmatispora sp. TaxID=1968838 RepID=UPI0035E413C8
MLVRSEPPANAILRRPPRRVLLWFSEPLVPQMSRAYVVEARAAITQSVARWATHLDRGDAHVAANDPRRWCRSLSSGGKQVEISHQGVGNLVALAGACFILLSLLSRQGEGWRGRVRHLEGSSPRHRLVPERGRFETRRTSPQEKGVESL